MKGDPPLSSQGFSLSRLFFRTSVVPADFWVEWRQLDTPEAAQEAIRGSLSLAFPPLSAYICCCCLIIIKLMCTCYTDIVLQIGHKASNERQRR